MLTSCVSLLLAWPPTPPTPPSPLQDFYGAYDAQEFATSLAPELGMQTVPSLNITYTEEKARGAGGRPPRGVP